VIAPRIRVSDALRYRPRDRPSLGKKKDSVEKTGITVVPVLRPVTDCRPSEQLGLNQMGILGGRETSRTRRPPGKKGVGSVRRGPTRIRRRPSPPTCRAWFPRLRLLPLLRPANHAPTSVATSQSTLPAVRRLGPTAPLLQLLYRARDPFRGPPNNSVVKCARSSWTLEGGTRGDFSGALLAYRSKKRFSLRPLPRPRLPSRSRFPFHRFT